jgi:hypothetical protein
MKLPKSKVFGASYRTTSGKPTKVSIVALILLVVLIPGSFGTLLGSREFIASVRADSSSTNASQGCDVALPSGSVVIEQTGTQTIAVWPDGTNHTYSLSAGNCSATIGYQFTINGYVENAYDYASRFYHVQDDWSVPAAPTIQGNQLIGLFNGIEDSTNIFQPILAWGCQYSFIFCIQGGNFWWISAEMCNFSCSYTQAIQVNVGDGIYGQVYYHATGCGYRGLQGHYDVLVQDTKTGQTASISGCSPGGGTAQAAALEVHNLDSCNKLPNVDGVSFSYVSSNPSESDWNVYIDTSDSPQCSYGVYHSASLENLYWFP